MTTAHKVLSPAVLASTIIGPRIMAATVTAAYSDLVQAGQHLKTAQRLCRELLTRLELAELELLVAVRQEREAVAQADEAALRRSA